MYFRLEVFEMQCWRMEGISWTQKRTNEDVKKKDACCDRKQKRKDDSSLLDGA